jgi:hypothetical protein
VLRITPTREGSITTLRLEGKLVGPWVDELRRAVEVASGENLHLDAGAVSYADPDGIDLLRKISAAGAIFSASSGFVAELLYRESRS